MRRREGWAVHRPLRLVGGTSLAHRNSTAGVGPTCGRCGAKRLVVRPQLLAKQRIDEIEHRRLAAKVQRQRQPPRRGNLGPQSPEDVRIGAAETIDRLLVVAHEKQLAAEMLVVAQRLDQIDLERIGILELVDQQQADLRGQPFPQPAVLRADQQILARGSADR